MKKFNMRRLPTARSSRGWALTGFWIGLAFSAVAQEGPSGITKPVAFPPFDTHAAACGKPTEFRKALTFFEDNQRKFMQGVDQGLALAAKDRGLAYELVQANNDPVLMIEQVRRFLTSKGGAMVVAPVDSQSLSPILKQVIWSGAYVGTVVPPPAISILNAPQYLTGKVLERFQSFSNREGFQYDCGIPT